MPCTPLRSVAEPIFSAISSMTSLRCASSVEPGVMTPSPLNLVSAKIATLSEVSATEISSFSSFRFERIWRADFSRAAPSGESVLISESFRVSGALINKSLSFNTVQSHLDAAIISSTLILPSESVSIILRVSEGNSRPSVGRLRTVQSFLSSSGRWAISSPLRTLTRTTPPNEQ